MSIVTTPVKIWRRKKKISELIGKKGVVETFTTVRVAPKGFGQYSPYMVAIVTLSTGEKLMGQIVESEHVVIGQRVVAVLRRSLTEGKKEVISYVIKFRPL